MKNSACHYLLLVMIKYIRERPIISFFALTYLINWFGFACYVAGFFPPLGEWPLMYDGYTIGLFRTRQTLLTWVPNFAAMIVVSLTSGWAGIRQLFRQFFIWRVGLKWWLTALLLPIAVAIMAVGLFILSGGKIDLKVISYLPIVFLLRNIFSLSTGSIGEEAGWRGFALPQLQSQWGALKASFIIGFFWATLHIPVWTLKGFNEVEITSLIISVLCLSLLFTWIYNTTRGSLLIVALMHNIINAIVVTLGSSFVAVMPREVFLPLFTISLAIVTVIIAKTTQGRLGLNSGT